MILRSKEIQRFLKKKVNHAKNVLVDIVIDKRKTIFHKSTPKFPWRSTLQVRVNLASLIAASGGQRDGRPPSARRFVIRQGRREVYSRVDR